MGQSGSKMESHTKGNNDNFPSALTDRSGFQSVRQTIHWLSGFLWQTLEGRLILGVGFVLGLFFIQKPYVYIGRFLKHYKGCFPGMTKKSLSVTPAMDLLEYCELEWKGMTPHADQIRKAYGEIYRVHNIRYICRVRGDNYCALRATLFQVLSNGIPFPSWMKEQDITKLPEKLFYSQGCNWIQQYSFGPEKYTGPKACYKLRKCIDLLKFQWGDIYGLKDKEAREKACKLLFMDESSEYKMYEAVKFLMLYLAIEMFEGMRHGQDVPNFCAILFSRDTSLDPFSFMLNHLNTIGDSGGLEQIEMFLLGYTLQLQMQTFRLYKYGTEEFEVSFTDVCGRDWHKITLLTEDDRHYNIPVTHQ
ncbi:inactive ubiquitin thioesterase OTULINL-like [Huso huso]|uniref:Inactive ubiquitin thioesterase OTULINL-like n=1 Tax=Huso huso TaxID=61971 RepID=A0ABR1A5G3_HUSHU